MTHDVEQILKSIGIVHERISVIEATVRQLERIAVVVEDMRPRVAALDAGLGALIDKLSVVAVSVDDHGARITDLETTAAVKTAVNSAVSEHRHRWLTWLLPVIYWCAGVLALLAASHVGILLPGGGK